MRSQPPKKMALQAIILAMLMVAFALRLYKVETIPLSLDEILTISRYVPLSVPDIFKTHHSNNQPMVSMLAHLFSPQADNLFLMRWPMILVGMLTLPFIYRLGATVFNQKVGLLALFLLTITPIHIVYSVVVRGYGGLILLTTMSLYFLSLALQYNRWRDWLGFVSGAILVIYFHMFGALAIATLIGMVSLWRCWQAIAINRNLPFLRQLLNPTFVKFYLAALLLVITYPILIYAQTTSVFSEGGHPGEFEVWRDGLSWPQDIAPLVTLLDLMAPISPGGIGAFIYLIFGIFGWVALWRQYRGLAIGIVIWFSAPFVTIFVAMRVFGLAFYAYDRFLLYLLPTFLILVTVGLLTSAARLLILGEKYGWQGRIAAQTVKWTTLIGLLSLVLISVNWYMLRATHTNWPGIAQVLLDELQPQDITICEEHQRGFEVPDRAKPYCIWMLDFFVPQLQEYTPRFQSSTDFIANYDFLQEQRTKMLGPGTVWLVIWQKVIFNPSHFITNERPIVMPPPPLSTFESYPAMHFGSATLVHINSEQTLFGNIRKTIELLLKVEQSPADQARYYRSLAEIEAVQGHADEARKFLEISWALVEQAGGQYPESFLANTHEVIKRIPDSSLPSVAAYQTSYQFGPSLCLQAYEVSPTILETDHSLKLTLYWNVLDFVDKDYTFFLRLDDQSGKTKGKLEFNPFDRVYPTPWWWVGQQLVEQQEFTIPKELPGQDYLVQLGAHDRKQGSDEEITTPLFLLSSRPNDKGAAGWHIESIPHSRLTCP